MSVADTGFYDFHRAFIELLKECKVDNLDVHKNRPKKPVHFQAGEFLIRVKQ
jgi:hypothetical protein